MAGKLKTGLNYTWGPLFSWNCPSSMVTISVSFAKLNPMVAEAEVTSESSGLLHSLLRFLPSVAPWLQAGWVSTEQRLDIQASHFFSLEGC